MIAVSKRATEQLKERLAQAYVEAGGLDMVHISPHAVEMLKEKLVKSCFEVGVGFRLLATENKHGETTLSIKVARAQERDDVQEIGGMRVFVDPVSASRLTCQELDYIDEPQGKFVLR